MAAQVANDELVNLLMPHFVAKRRSDTSWHGLLGIYQFLPQLRGLWPLSSVDENGAAYDLSGQGRTLTNNATTPFGVYALAPYADFTAASSQYFSRADEAGLSITGAFTFGCYVWFDSLGTQMGVVSKFLAAGNQRSFALVKLAANTLQFAVSELGTAASTDVVVSGAVLASQWYYVVCRYRPGTEIAIWVGGLSAAGVPTLNKSVNTTGIGAACFDSTTAFELGRFDGGSYLDGRIALPWLCANAHTDKATSGPMIEALWAHSRLLFGITN